MQTSLRRLIERNLFSSYRILAGEENMERPISSVSIMETPDFTKYVLENTLILSTLYPIRNDPDALRQLLRVLHETQSSGLVVKVKRYIEEVPNDVIEMAREFGLPLISLDYDANLSILIDMIIAEIHRSEYDSDSFGRLYSSIFHSIVRNPTTEALIDSVRLIDDLDVTIINSATGTTHTTDPEILEFFRDSSSEGSALFRMEDQVYYFEPILYEGIEVYRLYVRTRYDKRSLIYNYFEIFRLLIIMIYQKKQELFFKQNQLLIDFVMNITSSYNSNAQIVQAGQLFGWKIRFPVLMLLYQLPPGSADSPINATLLSRLRGTIQTALGIAENQLRLAPLASHLIVVANYDEKKCVKDMISFLYNRSKEILGDTFLRMAVSPPIGESKEIPSIYSSIMETLSFAESQGLSKELFDDHSVQVLRLLREIDYPRIVQFCRNILQPLVDYEESTRISLVRTYFLYIENKFNAKKTARDLYIHYNSLRYRLGVIESLGYPVQSESHSHFEIYLALYLYLHFIARETTSWEATPRNVM